MPHADDSQQMPRPPRRWRGPAAVAIAAIVFAGSLALVDPAPVAAAKCGRSLQARVDRAPAGAVLDLTGCAYSGGATIRKAITLVGAEVKVPANQRGLIVTASNVKLKRLVITGPQATTYRWNEVGVLTTGSVSNLKVRRSKIRWFGNTGIWVGRSSNTRITRTTVADTVYAGIMLISAADARVGHNVVRRVGVRGAAAHGNNAYGIAVSNDGSTPSSDVVVNGNLVEDVPTWHALDTHGGVRIAFTSNTVRRSMRGIFITSDGSGRRSRSIVVTGNRLLSPPANSQQAVTTYDAAGVTVTSNTAVGWGAGQFFGDTGGLSTGLVVKNNTVTP